MIDDVTGKSLPANYVFKMFIQAIVDHSLKKTNALDLRKSELRWVITFSTDFTSASNHFLRECAEQVGSVKINMQLNVLSFTDVSYKELGD